MKFKLLYVLLFVLTNICVCKKEKENTEVKKPLIEEGSASSWTLMIYVTTSMNMRH